MPCAPRPSATWRARGRWRRSSERRRGGMLRRMPSAFLPLFAVVACLSACGPQPESEIADYPIVRNPPQAYADGMVAAHDCLTSKLPRPWRLQSLDVDRRYPPEPGVSAGAVVFAPARDLGLTFADHDSVNQAVVLLAVSHAVEALPGASTAWSVYPKTLTRGSRSRPTTQQPVGYSTHFAIAVRNACSS